MISVISWTTVLASKGNFCKPLLDYSEKKDRIENVTVCRTKMEKKCEDVRKKLCLNVTEMKCKVELFPNCTMDWEWEDAVDFNTADKKPVEAGSGRPLVEEWEKMSKSKFNGVDPSQVLQQVCKFPYLSTYPRT